MISCTFAGHREIYMPRVDEKIDSAIRELLRFDVDFIFYTGGIGEFDSKCAAAIHRAKRKYPHLKIRLILVLPYMSNRLNEEKAFYEYYYDDIIIPAELDGVHYKAAIQKRNRWMVDNSDYLIACLLRDFGGAYEYAKRQGKSIINLTEWK